MNKVKITKDLYFGFSNLCDIIDWTEQFTLKDILDCCCNSILTFNQQKNIFHCNYIEDYIKEAKNKSKNPNLYRDIEYLEISLYCEKDYSEWRFEGVGYKGKIEENVANFMNLTKKEKENYREKYGIEMTPMYEISHLPIKIKKSIGFTDGSSNYKEIECCPNITLVELFKTIFWELSFYGSPKERDKRVDDLEKRLMDKNIKTVSSEEVFENIKKKYSVKKGKQNGMQ